MEHSEMSAVLATDRLRLRPLRAEDAPAIAEGIGDYLELDKAEAEQAAT